MLEKLLKVREIDRLSPFLSERLDDGRVFRVSQLVVGEGEFGDGRQDDVDIPAEIAFSQPARQKAEASIPDGLPARVFG